LRDGRVQATAALSVSPSQGTTPLQVTADAAGSSGGTAPLTYRFEWGDGATTGAQTSATATHTYSVVGTYTVTLTVTDGGGQTASEASSVTAAAPLGTAPAAPSDVAAGNLTGGQVTVVWTDNSDNETDFRVTDGTTTWEWDGRPCSQPTGCRPVQTIYNVPAGSRHCYRVRAFNDAGSSAWVPSGEGACVTTPQAAPQAATNVTATAISSSQIRISWTDNSDNEDGFTVVDMSNVKGLAYGTGPNGTSVVWPDLAAGTSMCFQVFAYNTAGGTTSPPSGVCATTPSS